MPENENGIPTPEARTGSRGKQLLLAATAVAIILAALVWSRSGNPTVTPERVEAAEHHDEDSVALPPDMLASAKLEYETVAEQRVAGLVRVTGTVELDQERTQAVTPLVSGRVERVDVKLGDRVRAGAVLAVIASPEIAQLHGKLHEAETRVALAERNLARVEQAENRAAVVSARARLDEAEVTLARTRQLVERGVTASMELVAAETAYKTAKAEYDFQSNIALNKEVAEARAEVETARVDASHIRHELEALGATVPAAGHDDGRGDSAYVTLRAPISGAVTERFVNAGAGVEAGKPLFTIGNISTVWVIANVPEGQVSRLRVGTEAEISGPAVGAETRVARVAYIDPRLDETTRTARVRLDVANPEERLKAGMFVEVGFRTGGVSDEVELLVPSDAVQRVGARTVVFVATDEPGRFEVRDVEVGGETAGLRRVTDGLEPGERVVTRGSFTLKTRMAQDELGGHDH